MFSWNKKHALFLSAIMVLVHILSVPLMVQAAPKSASSHKFFRHIMFRESPYAPYRGIHTISEKASQNNAHYQFSYDEKGRISEIRYQMNNQLINGNEVWDSFIWFSPKVAISYHKDKEIHTYYDVQNKQISAHGKVYRAVYALDKKGKRLGLSFFDEHAKPVESAWHIHRYEWRHENGKVYEKRFNLNNEQQPLRPEFTFYEVELTYDHDNKLSFVKNLGLAGKPTNNDSGAGIDRIIYDQHGNFTRWQVYDKDGNPVEGNRPMVHMGEHLYDEFGNKVGLRGYDKFGQRKAFSWGAFEHKSTYYPNGNQKSHKIFDENARLSRYLVIEYNQTHSHILWLKSLDEEEQLSPSPMLGGAAALKFDYQADGGAKRTLFNRDLTKYTPKQTESAE